MFLFALFRRYFSWLSPQAPLLSRQAVTLTVDHLVATEDRPSREDRASVDSPAADMAASLPEAVDTHRADTEVAAEAAIHRVDMEAAAEVDTNKSQSATHPTKANTSIHNCCTRSRKFCSSKSNWEAAAVDTEVAAEDTHQEDMEESHLAMAHQARAMEHPAAATAHPATAQPASSELNSDMSSLATKSLST
jgi:hypothetical protein